jgi:arylsulfatase A-like enzyme
MTFSSERSSNSKAKLAGLLILALAVSIAVLVFSESETKLSQDSDVNSSRPNILLIVADDLGFSDLGSFGGEISTPNLDRLAFEGLRLTNFHASPICSPTRSMLLTGVDQHLAGLGTMNEELRPNQIGQPGYEGFLNDRVVSVATLLRDAGYRTYMAGKWHLGLTSETSPHARGFDQTFALLRGGAGHFSNSGLIDSSEIAQYMRNGQRINRLPDDFYSTAYYTHQIIDFLANDRESNRPFFAYLSYTAPHFPLQARQATIEKYRGVYDAGYEKIGGIRLKQMQKLGLTPASIADEFSLGTTKSWDELTENEKNVEARKMETYAAMIDDLDTYIGELIDYLEKNNFLENTLIVFLSDNGAEGNDMSVFWPEFERFLTPCCNNELDNIGKADSFVWLGAGWGHVSSTPLHLFKGFVSDGGTRTPAFVYSAGGLIKPGISNSPIAVEDIVPTLLEAADVDPTDYFADRAQLHRMDGISVWPFLQGKSKEARPSSEPIIRELFGMRAVRLGQWKLVNMPSPHGTNVWQLFDIDRDYAELHDLALEYPAVVDTLKDHWNSYETEKNVIFPLDKDAL